jgi:hypothetical protein
LNSLKSRNSLTDRHQILCYWLCWYSSRNVAKFFASGSAVTSPTHPHNFHAWNITVHVFFSDFLAPQGPGGRSVRIWWQRITQIGAQTIKRLNSRTCLVGVSLLSKDVFRCRNFPKIVTFCLLGAVTGDLQLIHFPIYRPLFLCRIYPQWLTIAQNLLPNVRHRVTTEKSFKCQMPKKLPQPENSRRKSTMHALFT